MCLPGHNVCTLPQPGKGLASTTSQGMGRHWVGPRREMPLKCATSPSAVPKGPTGAAPSQSAGQWDLGSGDSQPCTLLSILPGHPGAGLGRAKPQPLEQKHWVPSAPCSGPGFSFWGLWAALRAWFQCAALWEQDPGIIPQLLCWRRLLVLLRPLLS